MMKRITSIFLSLALLMVLSLNTFAQQETGGDISIIVPAKSIEMFLTKLLPYDLDLGEYFSGSLQVKSIKNLKIDKNRILFSSHLYAKRIKYIPKIGDKLTSIDLGQVNLSSEWELGFRFDKAKKTLFIRPHLKEPAAAKSEGQRGTILNVLFKAFSDIDYPVDLEDITPVTAEFLSNTLTIGFDVSSIHAANNNLVVLLRPVPRKTDRSPAPTKTS